MNYCNKKVSFSENHRLKVNTASVIGGLLHFVSDIKQ